METTFAIIKPNAIQGKQIGKILTIVEEDFTIAKMELRTLTQEETEGFYAEHRERPFFSSLVGFMTSGPVVVLALEAEGAIKKWRTIMGATNPDEAGPGTIRKLYGESIEKNSTHGSDSPESAERELKYIFG